jgi:flagellar biosynthesis protein FlhF
MRLRRFTGTTIGEALRLVKATLGSEAVILETDEAPGRVTVTAATDGDAPAGGGAGDLVDEVRGLVATVRDLVDEHRVRGLPDAVRPLHRALLTAGVDGVIAAALVHATAERLGPETSVNAALAGTLATPATSSAARVRLFLGPPGDGKTTTVAKLAAQERSAGRRVALITADTYRVGGAAELTAYGRALGVPVAVVEDGPALARALAAAAAADVVLVDTFGASEPAELAELATLAESAGTGVVRTLVASAATGASGAARAWEAFAPLAPAACVLTKLDLAPGGATLGQSWCRRVPVTHVAAGRRIPDDLERATPARLARCLLMT